MIFAMRLLHPTVFGDTDGRLASADHFNSEIQVRTNRVQTIKRWFSIITAYDITCTLHPSACSI